MCGKKGAPHAPSVLSGGGGGGGGVSYVSIFSRVPQATGPHGKLGKTKRLYILL